MRALLLLGLTFFLGEGAVNVDNIHWLGHATFRIEDGRIAGRDAPGAAAGGR